MGVTCVKDGDVHLGGLCPLEGSAARYGGLEVHDQPKEDALNAEPGRVVAGTALWRVGGRAGVPLSGRSWGDRLMVLNSAPNMPQLGQKEGADHASHLVEA